MGRKKLTLEQHKEVASSLREVDRILWQALKTVQCAYPLQSKQARILEKLVLSGGYMDRLKSAMDDQLFRDHASLSTKELASIYYGRLPDKT